MSQRHCKKDVRNSQQFSLEHAEYMPTSLQMLLSISKDDKKYPYEAGTWGPDAANQLIPSGPPKPRLSPAMARA
jgi:glucose-6-phosphate 1-dehydrogenase